MTTISKYFLLFITANQTSTVPLALFFLITAVKMPISWFGMEKLNLTQQKHALTNQKKCTTTKNTKKLKPGLVASYSIRPGNGEGLYSGFGAS